MISTPHLVEVSTVASANPTKNVPKSNGVAPSSMNVSMTGSFRGTSFSDGGSDRSHRWKVGVTKGLRASELSDQKDLSSSVDTPEDSMSNFNREDASNGSQQEKGAQVEPQDAGEAEAGAGTASASLSQQKNGVGQNTSELDSEGEQHSLFQESLLNQTSGAVESVLGVACDSMCFDIAEVWLRTGPKTHQLINSHLRPTALEDSVRTELVDVYYGEKSSERTHRLSPALCKRAKEAMDVVWVTSHTSSGAEALRCSISDVRTAVAVPVCHEESSTNMTFIYFSIRRAVMKSPAVEFLVHTSLAAAVAAVNSLADEISQTDPSRPRRQNPDHRLGNINFQLPHQQLSRSEHMAPRQTNNVRPELRRAMSTKGISITGANLNLKWTNLTNVEYLTDGGNNWIHTAVMNRRSVVIKSLKPECHDLAIAMNEIEDELEIHSKLQHQNIVDLVGAGFTPKGSRFVVLERLDGGTLTQVLGYDNRIRDRRRRFWRRRQFSYVDVLKCARSIASAMDYCHSSAFPGCMMLHRDLKPDNIGFTLDGTVKLIDFGLSKIVHNASSINNDVYHMSGETGSLRYMSPEVAESKPYNHKTDVYSFGIILWEIVALRKPFDGMEKEEFYSRVIRGRERPAINKKWPDELVELITECWSHEPDKRPTFRQIKDKVEGMLKNEVGGTERKKSRTRISAFIDRHSTWF